MARDSKSAPLQQVRVGIYTRKSTDEGLDQEFNSLDNQREAIEAYILSQREQGWVALPDRYDDGGVSGATTNRPAFQKLLQDIKDGKIDVVAVYKYDRLSRSQLDFLQMMKFFDQHDVRFVSITQNFDTSTSAGRLFLGMLASFSQFEREMIADRTRDKIRASRQRGLWTGGRPPLGYDVQEKKLVVNEEEAKLVREAFDLYLQLGSLLTVATELNRRGRRNKTLRAKSGRVHPGKAFNKQTVRFLLTNPLFLGKVRSNGDLYDGVHEAIVDQKTWDAVQAQLASNGKPRRKAPRISKSILSGLLRCGTCGMAMSPHFAEKDGRRYRSYVCVTAQKQGAAACPGSRLPAKDIEGFVVDKVKEVGRNPKLVAEAVKAARKHLKERGRDLVAEVKRFENDQGKLEREQRNLVRAIGRGGNGASALQERLGEIDEVLEKATATVQNAQRELTALESTTIDEDDFRAAIESFSPVWDQLFPEERARILHLLIEEAVFNPDTGDLEITFRPGGVRALATETKEEAA